MPESFSEINQGLWMRKANEIIGLYNEETDSNVPLIKTKGFCAALTTLWLTHIKENKEAEFYQHIREVNKFPQICDFMNHLQNWHDTAQRNLQSKKRPEFFAGSKTYWYENIELVNNLMKK